MQKNMQENMGRINENLLRKLEKSNRAVVEPMKIKKESATDFLNEQKMLLTLSNNLS